MSELHVGFTGTEHGITQAQRHRTRAWMRAYAAANEVVGHHGDCIEGDVEFHRICQEEGIPVDIHPPSNPAKRAFCGNFRRRYPEKPYLARNRDIALCSSVVIACPREAQEVVRSGVWATVRAAVGLGRDVVIFPPDGGIKSYEEVRIR